MIDDEHAYDANGNVSRITDLPEGGLTSRVLAYDGLDRLTGAAGIWDAGTFGYDALDNLRTTTLGSLSTSTSLDAQLRVDTLTVNGVTQALGYDAIGNVRSKGTQRYAFDLGNRLTAAQGVASYLYDGHGRRVWMAFDDGRTRLQMYDREGRLLIT